MNAALVVPLADGEYRAAQRMLDRMRCDDGITYLVLLGNDGRVLAANGWEPGRPLPLATFPSGRDYSVGRIDRAERDPGAEREARRAALWPVYRFHVDGAQRAHQRQSRDRGLALVLSILLMTALCYWLTRSLSRLTQASARLAAGDIGILFVNTGNRWSTPTRRSDVSG